ncbi:(d)CMP kinase [Promineifilum sp.]|uniref:(d)CMP kinase n=1 Tax=Promineifilum sp. TaxID=2664178 RepID=UPI0035AD960A
MQSDLLPDVITIDGPAASGKSTVGYMLAQRLGYLFLDTGSMYRAVTLAALRRGISPDDEAAVAAVAHDIELDFASPAEETDGRHCTVLLDGEDVTWVVRRPDVDAAVSQVSTYPAVRAEMVRRQRAISRRGHIVMVGRDIGTVVMPDAPLKLYITASAQERARRRLLDRQRQGLPADYDAILANVIHRDRTDSNRRHSPLRPAHDAVIIDTTDRPAEVVLREVLALLQSTIAGVVEQGSGGAGEPGNQGVGQSVVHASGEETI